MSSLIDLFNPSFLMFLGILVLVVALVVVYFESKVREQNHKIASMLSLVSTLAEDINGVKMGLNHLAITRFGGSVHNTLEHINPTFISKDSNELIEVSDDEEDESCDDDDEDENNDDDDEDENNDEEDENEFCDEGKQLYEEEEASAHEDIKVLKLNICNEIDIIENNHDNNKEEINLEDLDNNLEDLDNNLENHELESEELKNTDFKTININLEDLTDYKNLSLNKLRNIVNEKGLSIDVSKFNKNKLLKLLGVK